jgi:TonB-linked SusC/RagA family outer membrane protein
MRKFTLFLAFMLSLGVQQLLSQEVVLSGVVTFSGDNQPLPGVQVIVKGTTLGTVTDNNGKYSIQVPATAKFLVFRYIGMITKEVEIGTQKTIDVVLEPDILDLEGVVVTALGISREKKALGYAVQDVKGEEIAIARENNIVNSLQGRVAGVQITNASGAIGASSRIVIRGNSSFGNNQPLFVIDGVPVLNSSSEVSQYGDGRDYGNATVGQDFGNAAMDIDPADIESVSILKGANAAALYGSRAANGVVLITTKKGARAVPGRKQAVGVDFSTGLTLDRVYLLPKFQNSYGQGWLGDEFTYNRWKNADPANTLTYQQYADSISFRYVDGNGSGINDYVDESWGPRLDAGLKLRQFDSPYTLDANGNPVFEQTPWVSHKDNVKDFFETGTTWSNNLSITGGTERAVARLSLNRIDQKGTIPNTDLKKTSVGISGDMVLSKRLSAGGLITYVQNTSDNLPGGGYDENNIMQSLGSWFGRQVNLQSLKDKWETDNPWGNPYNWNSSFHNNPYWTVNKNTTSRTRDRVFGNAYMKYKITDWLDVMGRLGTDLYNEYRKHLVADRSIESSRGGSFWQSQTFEQETNADLILTLNREIHQDFTLNASAGANYRNYKRQFKYMRAAELTVPDLYTISNVSGNASSSMNYAEKETNSLFGSFSLGYKRFLYLDVTGRNDWSSTLPKDNWSYFYPSVSLSYVFTENLKIPEKILSYGKIRGGWAQVGNDTDPYQILGTYSQTNFTNNPIDPIKGVAQFHFPYVMPPADLVPEQTNSFEVGTDLKFIKNRVGLDFTYYNMKTKDQILAVDISNASGFQQMLINAGEIQNQGVEVMLSGKPLEKKDGLNWEVSVNWATNTNKVNKLYGDLEAYVIARSWGSVTVEARPGEPYGQIKGGAYVRDGSGRIIVDPETHLPIHSSAPQVIGNILPDWFGGIRNTFTYKDFSLSFLFDMRMGGDIFSVTDWFGAYAGVTEETAENNKRETGVLVEGVYGKEVGDMGYQYLDANGDPSTTAISNDVKVSAEEYYHDYWGLHEPSIIKGSFIKFREVVFGWNLPAKWIDKVDWVQSASFSVVGRNLAMLWVDESNDVRMDPETGFGTTNNGMGLEQYQVPATRSIGFQLRVIF